MKITPLEIRQKTFEKAFRGLDKDEVMAFLATLSTEWEKMQDENKELKIKLESSEKEVEKLREVENSLFKTLKTAEDTGASMIDQATKAAQLHMKETEMKAEALMNEAKSKAKDMLEEAEVKSKNAVDDMEDRLRTMAQIYRNLENVKEDLLSDIKTFATEAIEKANRVKAQLKQIDIDEELMKVKRDSKSVNKKLTLDFDTKLENTEPPVPKELKVDLPEPENKEKKEESKPVEAPSSNSSDNSFFDDFE
ncbi:MAG: DivIVA domain-containing protein [Fulvivirga sp.]|uniref:DivIVA domain-containing protein n=1 Tax=Fulvivirga sp. TaxID=1931237 RepID=UPI0032EDEF9B